MGLASGGPERKAAAEARHHDDASSVASVSTRASTVSKDPKGPVVHGLSQLEEKEARKYEKVLREIAKLEERQKSGEELDPKQVEKIMRRAEVENTIVMQKVRLGFVRHESCRLLSQLD